MLDFMFKHKQQTKDEGYILRMLIMPIFKQHEIPEQSQPGIKMFHLHAVQRDLAKLVKEARDGDGK